jgi:hypothetical protein
MLRAACYSAGMGVRGVWWHITALFAARLVAASAKLIFTLRGADIAPGKGSDI